MKKILLCTTLFILIFNSISAQNMSSEFWDNLLLNNRETAKKIISENEDSSIEWLVSNEILRMETGKISRNESFLDAFLNNKDFEYYLYAFWNHSFIFDDYLGNGFDKDTYYALDKIASSNVDLIDLKDAITYLLSVKKRYINDWDSYYNLNSKINAVKDWQYCGSFENLNKSGLDKFYEPELESSNDVVFDAKSNGDIKWYNGTGSKEAYQFYTNHNEYGSSVNYAQTFVTSAIDQRIIVRVGCGSAFKIFLNDIEIFKNDKDVGTDLNGYEVKVNLQQGVNRLVIKTAESNSTSYFLISLLDENKVPLDTIKVSKEPVDYNKSTLAQLNPVEKENDFENYFKSKIASSPKNFLYSYALFSTYIRNGKYNEAREVITPYYKKYPKSSLLRKTLITTYNLETDYTSVNELNENIERDDPDYYLPIINKVSEYDELSRLSLDEFEDYIERLKIAFDSDLLKAAAEFLYYARKEDISGLKVALENLNTLSEENGNIEFKLNYIPLYDQLFQDQDKTISLLEDIVKNYFNLDAENRLIRYYEDKNQKEKSLDIVVREYDNLITDNVYIKRIANKYVEYQMFEKALPYVDQMLKNYPYSFVAMEQKGDILKQLGKSKEALSFYEKALQHNSADSGLRKKIDDISNKSNLLKDLALESAYDFIEENRNKITSNNYGFNILFDDSNIEMFEEGGFKYRYTYVYEITSNNGIDTFKEYNLGLGGSYKFLKSELVKPDGSLVPADRSGSNLVFNDITIGDVVYIDYEGTVSTTGRFYKDISDKIQFDSFHPSVLTTVDILIPKTSQLHYKFMNGDLKPKITDKKGYKLYQWELKNAKAEMYAEDYMPNSVDQVGYLHFSTIKEWNDISVWYSDLVRSRIEINNKVKAEFKKLFPNGHEQLSEDERSRIIYNYITSNFNYSYVSFKQSGFIPQKPAKTINTSLGDCKDFSTLYVTLAKMADLQANLILILTSDYGRNNLVLPSTDFNHCIVKVILDGIPQYLELTNKYLPYKSLPTSLRGATALEIPFSTENTDKKYNLFHLDKVQRDMSLVDNSVIMNVSEENTNLIVTTKINGHNVAYYNEVFAEPNAEVIKKTMSDDYSSKLKDEFTLNKVYDFEITDNNTAVLFNSDITINKKLSSIGSIKILQLPIISHPYENSIIQLEERNYPIDYIQYENVDAYNTTYILEIEEGKTFVEIPESKSFKFKEHSYTINYENSSPNKLKVIITSNTPYDNIMPEDYKEYKAYVKGILDAQAEYIGFK